VRLEDALAGRRRVEELAPKEGDVAARFDVLARDERAAVRLVDVRRVQLA
jgi:hypothetical protein